MNELDSGPRAGGKIARAIQERHVSPASADVPGDVIEARPLAFDVQERVAKIDLVALRRFRLDRVRAELSKRDYAGALLLDPMNIRYATGTRNMQIWTMRVPGRYVFIATNGPVVMFEFSACKHLSQGFETIDELRTGISWCYLLSGSRTTERAREWAGAITSLVHQHGGGNKRLAVDRCEPWVGRFLVEGGLELFDGQEPLEHARSIKSAEDIACLQLAMDVCDVAVDRLKGALRPGVTENQLWAVLHETNIAHDGEFIDCRLLASGPRTNPWFQECGNRVIGAGDLVAFDTDMIGPMGAMADISRAYVCPGKAATSSQRALYSLAKEQVLHNVALLKPGLSFDEFAARSWRVPEEFYANRYMALVHGVGVCDEWPVVLYAGDQEASGYDGVFAENMVVSVESYLGAVGGSEGVKLEQQVLITHQGAIPFSRTPFKLEID